MLKTRRDKRRLRHRRVRRKVHGTAERPRMAIMLSNRYIYVQLIDDETGRTVAEATSRAADAGATVSAAANVGRDLAEKAVAQGIRRTVVDRGGFTYCARVKAIVDAAEEAGLSARNAQADAPVAVAADAPAADASEENGKES